MEKKMLGNIFTHELKLNAGTAQGYVLGKLENVVLLGISGTPSPIPGGDYVKTFTFATLTGGSETKGAVRFDMYDASTGELTQGNDIVVDLTLDNTGLDASGPGGQKTYQGITRPKKDKILEGLRNSGATITGNNPWDVNLHNNGVKLRGTWDESKTTLRIEITNKNWYVPESKIWSTIDELISKL